MSFNVNNMNFTLCTPQTNTDECNYGSSRSYDRYWWRWLVSFTP